LFVGLVLVVLVEEEWLASAVDIAELLDSVTVGVDQAAPEFLSEHGDAVGEQAEYGLPCGLVPLLAVLRVADEHHGVDVALIGRVPGRDDGSFRLARDPFMPPGCSNCGSLGTGVTARAV
jgi:hypothetical protein